MKTIISGPKPDGRKPFPVRNAAIAGSCLGAAAIVAAFAMTAPARGTELPETDLPETGIVRTASMDGYGIGADAPYSVPSPDPVSRPEGATYALEVRKSAQSANGAWDPDGEKAAGSGQDAAQDGVPDEDRDSGQAGASSGSPEAAAVPASSGEAGGQHVPPANQAAQDGDAQELLDAKNELQAATDELAATRRELEAARKALADAKAAQEQQAPASPAVPSQPSQPPQEAGTPAGGTDAPEETAAPGRPVEEEGPPSWIVPYEPAEPAAAEQGAAAGQVPWIADQLERAAFAIPYDGGPLCQASYAEIPCPVDNATTRMYVELGAPLSSLTQADLLHFALRSVRLCEASWATVIGSDGLGIQFLSCATSAAVVGPVDEYGRVTDIVCYIVLTDEGYGIVPYA